jgi:hypothetical protein
MKEHKIACSFSWRRRNLSEVLVDSALSSLGDSYINFVYSVALSNKKGEPEGTKVKGSILAEALRKAGLREYLPSRMSRHSLADAAEALAVYAWLDDCLRLDEAVDAIRKINDPVEALTRLLVAAKERVTFP